MKVLADIFRKHYERLVFVEIEVNCVQLLVVACHDDVMEIRLLAQRELAFKDTEQLAIWLKETVESSLGSSNKTAYLICLNNEEGLHELLKLPQLTGKQLQEAVLWELPQYVSWVEGTYCYDFRKLMGTDDEEYTAVELVVATKESLGFAEALQKMLGWKSLGMTVSNKQLGPHKLSYVECTFSSEEKQLYDQQYASILYQATLFLEHGHPLLLHENRGILYNDFFPRICIGLGVIILLGTIGYTGKLYYAKYKLEKQLVQTEQKLKDLALWERQHLEGTILEQKIKDLHKRLPGKDKKALYPEIVLPALSKALSNDCWIDKFSLDVSKALMIQGRTTHVESVQQLLSLMEKRENIAKLELRELQQLRNNILSFTLSTPQEVNNEQKKVL